MPIHVAITRRIRSGCETEFQAALREFIRDSFSHEGVLGATMLVPPPGSNSREYGIIRTFANEQEQESFYESPLFRAWDSKCASLYDSTEWDRRPLHGLEAWFRSPHLPPPRWKMALATFLGVFPLASVLQIILGPWIQHWPFLIRNAVFNAAIVALLSWAVMPLITRLLHPWLHPSLNSTSSPSSS